MVLQRMIRFDIIFLQVYRQRPGENQLRFPLDGIKILIVLIEQFIVPSEYLIIVHIKNC